MQVFAIQSKTPPHWLAKSLAAAPRHRVSAPLQSRSVLSVLPAYLPATSCVLPGRCWLMLPPSVILAYALCPRQTGVRPRKYVFSCYIHSSTCRKALFWKRETSS